MDNRPNILLFTTDQHRGDHIGLASHPVVETPNLDAFINRGAYFPNAYSEIPSTTGARRCLHGGQGSYACGLIGYAGVEWHERNTLAQVLADAGYHCINVGWRNMHPRRKLYGFHSVIPHDLGEDDEYAEWLRREVEPRAHERGHGCGANAWLARPWHLEERCHPTVWTTDVTFEQIKRRDPTRPFFVWCSHLRPHSPYDPPQFFWDMYINREFPPIPVGDWAAKHDVEGPPSPVAWRGKFTPERNQRMRAGYAGVITHIDYELGRLLEQTARELGGGMMENTLIIFTSDHGDMMGDHHLHRKTYAYEGSARIPFVVRYPTSMEDLPTGTFQHVVGLQDVMPTILEAAGVAIPGSVTGTSVLRAIRGGSWREYLHGEHSPCYAVEQAMHFLTDGKEKYVWFPATEQEQFFDLQKDRQELRDLARDPAHRERVNKWRQRLIKLLAQRGDGFSDGERLIPRKEWWSPIVGESAGQG